MARLKPEKLNVRVIPPLPLVGLHFPRRYTLTHSDRTGDLFLTIGQDYDYSQIKGWYTKLMRDEVLAEMVQEKERIALHVYCQVSRGLGTRGFRETIFRRELPLVLEAIRLGDRELFDREPHLDQLDVLIHFCTKTPENDIVENWGPISQYRI
ncbi:MAG: staygreen family protein [Candidatus Hodarchaeota archaeon]